jgi:hypothetical protein
MNWSKEQLMEALKKNPALRIRKEDIEKIQEEKQHKFNAKPGYLDGYYFRSQAEMERYCELKILKASGFILGFELQPKFDIGAGMKYTADFKVIYTDHEEIEEVKGKWTTDAKMRVKLFKERYPDKILKIIRNGKEVIV